MQTNEPILTTTRSANRRSIALALAAATIAVVAGLPSLSGGFLSGDDYHLVRNHVLVNHPSLTHAAQIFTIIHRDLYQPIPMLSFQIDFAVINALGLHPTPDGPHAGAWVFHLSNILFHAINAALVFFTLKRLTRRTAVAAVASFIFAAHPLAGEAIGWLNGRMMMLSTGFALATLIAFDKWYEKPTSLKAVGVVLLAIFAHISKISLSLPILLVVFPLYRRQWPTRKWWILWSVIALVTVLLGAFNIVTSKGMFEHAESEMSASPIIYVCMAIAQYFRQFLVPVGLSHWYPPPRGIHWLSPEVISAAITVTLVFVVAAISAKRTRIGLLGLLWFLSAVGPTLPIVPARRALAADRYVYLPNIGLAWIAAAAIVAAVVFLRRRAAESGRKSLAPAAVIGATACGIAAFVGVTWHTLGFYKTNVALAERIIVCNPDQPGVYESAAWALYRAGRYEDAIEIAQGDLDLNPEEMGARAHQVIAMSQFRLQRYREAIASLKRAIQADPEFGKCYSRMGQVLAHLGRYDEAILNYERAIEIMPTYNPGIVALASLYRTVGRIADAEASYRRAITNNPYEVAAHLALAEIDIQNQRYAEAADRLEKLLDWMPENTVARTNLGLALEKSGDFDAAIRTYQTAIKNDPNALVAVVNLADLYRVTNRPTDAQELFSESMPTLGTNLAFLIAYHDFTLSTGQPAASLAAWERAVRRNPNAPDLRLWYCYTLAQAQRTSDAERMLGELNRHPNRTLYSLAQTLVALQQNQPEAAVAAAREMLAIENPSPPDAKHRLTGDLQRFAETHADDPWPYFLTAMVLRAEGQPDVAGLAMAEFDRRCRTDDCRSLADRLGS
jgi:protein O-mannosyl-transferase